MKRRAACGTLKRSARFSSLLVEEGPQIDHLGRSLTSSDAYHRWISSGGRSKAVIRRFYCLRRTLTFRTRFPRGAPLCIDCPDGEPTSGAAHQTMQRTAPPPHVGRFRTRFRGEAGLRRTRCGA